MRMQVNKEQLNILMRTPLNFSIYLKSITEIEFEKYSDFQSALLVLCYN